MLENAKINNATAVTCIVTRFDFLNSPHRSQKRQGGKVHSDERIHTSEQVSRSLNSSVS
jgi:hypothetical protein